MEMRKDIEIGGFLAANGDTLTYCLIRRIHHSLSRQEVVGGTASRLHAYIEFPSQVLGDVTPLSYTIISTNGVTEPFIKELVEQGNRFNLASSQSYDKRLVAKEHSCIQHAEDYRYLWLQG